MPQASMKSIYRIEQQFIIQAFSVLNKVETVPNQIKIDNLKPEE